MKVAQFVKTEAQAKQEWMRHLISCKEVPLDFAMKAKCEIKKEYLPYTVFDMECAAGWSATSIREHEESYQEAVTKTVYIDYQGKEHSSPGQDSEYVSGKKKSVYHHRTPQQRTEYVTKYRTVEDERWLSEGQVGPAEISHPIALCDFPDIKWTQNVASNQFVAVDESYFSDSKVIPVTVTDKDAFNQFYEMAVSELSAAAKRDVPGDRYVNFSLDEPEILKQTRTDLYLGVYHIVYEYEGEEYEGYISGSANDDDFLFEEMPVDDAIKERNTQVSKAIEKNGSCLLSVGGIASLFFSFVFFISSGGSSLWTYILLVGGIYCIARAIVQSRNKKKLQALSEQLSHGDQSLRMQILDIVEDTSVSEDETQQKVSVWVESHKDRLGSNAQEEISKLKAPIRLLNICGIAGVVVVVVISVVLKLVNGY